MSARKVVEASTFKAPSLLFGADPQAVKKRAARVVNTVMELIILFIYDPFYFPHHLVREVLNFYGRRRV
jgi:hypothetical protein